MWQSICEKLSPTVLRLLELRGESGSQVFASFLLWSIQVCANTMSRRQDISIAAHLSGRGYEAIFKQFRVHYSRVGKIIQNWKTFKFTLRSDRPMHGETAGKKSTQVLHLKLYRPK